MKLVQVFAHAMVRRIAYALVALALLCLGVGRAEAASDMHPTESEAAQHCNAVVTGNVQAWCAAKESTSNITWAFGTAYCTRNGSGLNRYDERGTCVDTNPANGTASPTAYHASVTWYHSFTTACPVGTSPDPTDSYICKSPDQLCADRAGSDPLGDTPQPRTWTSKCVAGCTINMVNPTTTDVRGVGTIHRGVLEWGASCGTVTPPGPSDQPDIVKKTQECVPVAGQTMCVKANGDHCYSASTGRQICWGSGETGTKTDGPSLQTRGPGTNAPPPPTPPAGETLNPPSPPITTTTTTTTNTTTTTTNTYTTVNGTDGGPTDDGEPGDGSDPDNQGTGDCGLDQKLCDEANALDTSQGDDVDGNSVWGASEGEFTPDESGFGFSRTCPVMPQMQSLDGQQLDGSELCTLMTWVGFLILAAAHAHALYIMFGD